MRVIAGQLKGRRLTAPRGLAVRPAPDRLKEAVFNVLQFSIPGARVLDLCAGSGAVGIEAISRGASETVLVESDAAPAGFIQKNLQNCKIESGCELLVCDARVAIERLAARGRRFDLVFFDPPYASEIYEPVLQRLGQGDLLADEGQVIVMHHHRRRLPSACGRLDRFRELRQGENVLTFYRLAELTPLPALT